MQHRRPTSDKPRLRLIRHRDGMRLRMSLLEARIQPNHTTRIKLMHHTWIFSSMHYQQMPRRSTLDVVCRRWCLHCKANPIPVVERLRWGWEINHCKGVGGRLKFFHEHPPRRPIDSVWSYMDLRAPCVQRLELAITGALELATRPKSLPFPHQTSINRSI